jgi:SPP1 family predicted phage head-tail adaptor
MRAGRLDRSITIQRVADTVDDAGTVAEAWADLATMRAELVNLAATETDLAAGPAATRTIMFRTRYLAGITVADRVLYEGDEFKITSVVEIGRRRALELHAERVI